MSLSLPICTQVLLPSFTALQREPRISSFLKRACICECCQQAFRFRAKVTQRVWPGTFLFHWNLMRPHGGRLGGLSAYVKTNDKRNSRHTWEKWSRQWLSVASSTDFTWVRNLSRGRLGGAWRHEQSISEYSTNCGEIPTIIIIDKEINSQVQ